MEIDGFNPVPDGGTQIKSTGELDGTSITNIESGDGLVKVHYEVVSEIQIAGLKKIKKPIIKKTSEFQSVSATILSQENYLNLKNNALALITGAGGKEELEELRVKYLGRKGEINRMLAEIPKMAVEKKMAAGEAINDLKRVIEEAIAAKSGEILVTGDSGWVDLTGPGIRPPEGHLHIVTQAIMEITRIFEKIGFTRVRHPEVDWDWYAFESLNMPPNHPARDEWETFHIKYQKRKNKSQSMVLTPHTSNGQVREMEKGKLPIRMINIAKCYRRQSDVSHVPMFHQFEGMYIDRNVSVGHLKGFIDYFVKQYFGPERKSRLRPFHFQFTEPSFEVDISCANCDGKGCRLCKEGWLELAGSGMIHPTVLKNGGVDPDKYSGFAIGWGIERTSMMKSGTKLDDVRLLYSNDVRFLEQF